MLFLGLLTTVACLPKFWESQCINDGKCTNIKVQSESKPSEHPFEMSRDDTSFDVKLGDFQLTDRGLTAKTYTRETCRALHLAERTYVVVQKKWYHKPFKNYSKVDDFYVNGDYLPCSDWIEDDSIQIAPKISNGTPPSQPLTSTNGVVEIPSTLLGLGLLENPTLPVLRFQIVEQQRKIEFVSTLPERNASWLCDTIPNIQHISAQGHYSEWTIAALYEETTLTMPYIVNENPRLLQFSDAISQCDSKERNYLGGIIAASAKANPESYSHLNYLYSELFGKKLSKPRRPSNSSAPKNTSVSKSSDTNSSRSIVGTYQCNQNGQMAYFRIYRNGVFNLKLELQNGSAQGVCGENNCSIDSINNSAVNFTGGVNKFSIRRNGDSLIMNGNVRCTKRS